MLYGENIIAIINSLMYFLTLTASYISNKKLMNNQNINLNIEIHIPIGFFLKFYFICITRLFKVCSIFEEKKPLN